MRVSLRAWWCVALVLAAAAAAPADAPELRAAYYVPWHPGSYAALREHAREIDLLFPEWLHVFTPDGRLQAHAPGEGRLRDVVGMDSGIAPVDTRVLPLLHRLRARTRVVPLVNNFDHVNQRWVRDLEPFFNDPGARANFRRQLLAFLASGPYAGVSIDFEGFPAEAHAGYRELIAELARDLKPRGLKLYVNVPPRDANYDYAFLAEHADGVVLMNYDQHWEGSGPGPVAEQAWFTENLREFLARVPPAKAICAVGNYGYEWPAEGAARSISVPQAWEMARQAGARIELDRETLNPSFRAAGGAVWFLDATTALNQMRAATRLGVRGFALWRLGAEDRGVWEFWRRPGDRRAAEKLRRVPGGYDIETEGYGEAVKVARDAQPGRRELRESGALITEATLAELPQPFRVRLSGARHQQVVLSFDDGPDPRFTPQILDLLKQEKLPAVFLVTGRNAARHKQLLARIRAEGHELGNHTYTHPRAEGLPAARLARELERTRREIARAAPGGPLYFRPPYWPDVAPQTDAEARVAAIAQQLGYTTIGARLDPNDWDARRTAEQVVADVIRLAETGKGNIILLHDGGGDRAATVQALPAIVRELRARGFRFVSLRELLAEPPPALSPLVQ